MYLGLREEKLLLLGLCKGKALLVMSLMNHLRGWNDEIGELVS